jgi:predicted phage replisome organizer
MSDNKQYYYLKLKDNYFDKDNIKILESMKNGHVYSLIILKLYIKSCKYDGKLMMTHEIPYNPKDVDILANVINHDIDHVKEAIKNGIRLGLITLLDSKEFWMTEIQNFIGHSSTEADRIREYRKQLKLPCTNVQQKNDICTPELKKDIKKNIKIKIKEKEIKIKYRNNIHLTEKQHNTLISKYGIDNVNRLYDYLSDYKIEKGTYKTKCDYRTILRWVVSACKISITSQPIKPVEKPAIYLKCDRCKKKTPHRTIGKLRFCKVCENEFLGDRDLMNSDLKLKVGQDIEVSETDMNAALMSEEG